MFLDEKLSIRSWDSYGQSITTTLFNSNGTASFSNYNTFVDISLSENFIGSELQLLINHNGDVEQRVNQILGKYAEAIIVHTCNKYAEINAYFAHIARFALRENPAFVNRYVAIGTDLNSTLNSPYMIYHRQANDQQRDIVWVNKKDVMQLLTVPNRTGYIAGLQVKCYHNWSNLKLDVTKYCMPIVYFDMNDDYGMLKAFIDSKKSLGGSLFENPWVNVTLVEPSDILAELKQKLNFFKRTLIQLLNKQITVQYVIDMAKAEGRTEIGRAITGPSSVHSQQIIVPHSSIQESQMLITSEQFAHMDNFITQGVQALRY